MKLFIAGAIARASGVLSPPPVRSLPARRVILKPFMKTGFMNAARRPLIRPRHPPRAAHRFCLSVCLFARLGWAFLCALSAVPVSAAGAENREAHKALAIIGQHGVPIRELSGLAIAIPSAPSARPASEKEDAQAPPAPDTPDLHLYAVGDTTHEVARLRIDRASGKMDARVNDVALLSSRDAGEPSQWEAVAADGAGTVCLLSEKHSEISCLGPELGEERARFSLQVSGTGDLDRDWEQHPNSRGEGMILLRNGHILVLKEKRPAALIEFGPEGEAPMGYGADSFLRENEAFSLSPRPPEGVDESGSSAVHGTVRFTALRAWTFSDRLNELAKDASEIALGPDGRVYLLSQESAVIVRLERNLKPTEKKVTADEGAYWRLPSGTPAMGKAEGLVIDRHMRPWIGSDIKQRGKPNLFQMSPLTQ